ncbi:MAG: pilus assembly protein PilP [Myxococcota bacterium]
MTRTAPRLYISAVCVFGVGLSACGSTCGGGSVAPPSNARRGLNVLTEGTAGGTSPGSDGTPEATTPSPAATSDDPGEIPYAYSPIGKRDPFRNLFDQLEPDEREQELTDLQKFELDQLRLVGVVSRISTPYAMVEDPEGRGHTLVRGTLIGKNWGQVSLIKEDCVTVKEEYRDYTGRKVTNKTSLCLPKPEELKLD